MEIPVLNVSKLITVTLCQWHMADIFLYRFLHDMRNAKEIKTLSLKNEKNLLTFFEKNLYFLRVNVSGGVMICLHSFIYTDDFIYTRISTFWCYSSEFIARYTENFHTVFFFTWLSKYKNIKRRFFKNNLRTREHAKKIHLYFMKMKEKWNCFSMTHSCLFSLHECHQFFQILFLIFFFLKSYQEHKFKVSKYNQSSFFNNSEFISKDNW